MSVALSLRIKFQPGAGVVTDTPLTAPPIENSAIQTSFAGRPPGMFSTKALVAVPWVVATGVPTACGCPHPHGVGVAVAVAVAVAVLVAVAVAVAVGVRLGV